MLPPHALNVFVPLVKCDVSNGGTEFVPGTHADWTASSHSYVLDSKPGDALVADWRLKHRGLANRTREDRPLLYLTYARPWFTDATNYSAVSLDD